MVRLSELVARLGGTCAGAGDPAVRDVHQDSRRVAAGTLFAALPGGSVDGARFVPEALARGAVGVLSPRALDGLEGGATPHWIHPEARAVAGRAAALVHGQPWAAQSVVAVTGTNGKSTVVSFTAQLARSAGRRPGSVGTLGVELAGGTRREATHTTPDATELARLARENLEEGGDLLCLEASSHALDQERLEGIALDVAVFTNLSHDHLDYHASLGRYAEAKARIVRYLKPGGLVVLGGVADGDAAARLGHGRMLAAAREADARVITYGIGSRWDLHATRLEDGPRGTHLFLEGMGILRTGLFLPLLGRHNVENALAALAAILGLGASPRDVLPGLAAISSPRGRLEEVDVGGRGFRVFVDYAHSPDALVRVLGTLRNLLSSPGEERRLLCVFGCGGGRDAEKRHPMGAAAAELADVAIVTNDNPRDEDPRAIAEAVVAGARAAREAGRARAEVIVELDRRAAIRAALERAREGDLVLVAGKGHEAWQRLRDETLPFDDAAVVREELP